MKKGVTKYLPESDLTRLQSISAICQDIGYIFNRVLRSYDSNSRYKVKNVLHDMFLDPKCNIRLGKTRLGIKDSVQVHLNIKRTILTNTEEYPNEAPYVSIRYQNRLRCADVCLSDIRCLNLLTLIRELTNVRDRMVEKFDIDKSELGKYKQLPAMIIKDNRDRITRYRHGSDVQDTYDKYIFIYDKMYTNPSLSRALKYFKVNKLEKTLELGSITDRGYLSPSDKVLVTNIESDYNRYKTLLPTVKEINNTIKFIRYNDHE